MKRRKIKGCLSKQRQERIIRSWVIQSRVKLNYYKNEEND
jgi:hypothetical protein